MARPQFYGDFVTTLLTNQEDLELAQSFELKVGGSVIDEGTTIP
jgi:hypothetical protein